MAYIRVDHRQLEKAASAIDTYVSKHKSNMQGIEQTLNGLGTSWQGADYQQLKTEWRQINAQDSTSGKMLKSLESYGKYLKYAQAQYKQAQSKAVNRANSLPK